MEIATKLGRTLAAGSGSFGARQKVCLVFQRPESGSVSQVRAGGSQANFLQGSGRVVCVLTGGAGARCNDESEDEFYLSRWRNW